MRINLLIVVVAGLTAMFVALSPSAALAQGQSESTSPFVTDPDLIPAGPLPAFEPVSLLMLEPDQHHQELSNEGAVISSLILEKGGNIFWDGQAKKLHADAFTLALTTYRNVEHWIYQWDGTQWVSIGWKKQESDQFNRVEVVTVLTCGWGITSGTYTQTSRHHARNNVFQQETVTINDYPHRTVNCN